MNKVSTKIKKAKKVPNFPFDLKPIETYNLSRNVAKQIKKLIKEQVDMPATCVQKHASPDHI
jgi:hypothetical protein